MELTITSKKPVFCAEISGKFTFADTATFKDVLSEVEKAAPASVELDLAALTFVDSAALGMFLLLKDAAGKHDAKVTLKGANGQVEKLLKMSRFDQIFQLVG